MLAWKRLSAMRPCLHCVLLPQTLYYINQCFTAHAFLNHCHEHLPILARYLSSIPLHEILEVLTARSTSLTPTYDRLEYLGDAVLKLIHTDALMNLNKKELSKWNNCLRKGDLSASRSLMGCNSRLHEVAKYIGIDKFILTVPLKIKTWVPLGFERVEMDQSSPSPPLKIDSCDVILPSEKVCADVIEALIGIVYLKFGYDASIEVTEELYLCPKIPFPSKDRLIQAPLSSNTKVQQKRPIHSFLGITNFKKHLLLEEALAHVSVHSKVPCNQKLKWTGDAVIGLASREFAYNYPNLKEADMMIIEHTLNCYETLSVLAYSKNIDNFIQHLHPSLRGRIENSPKVLAGVVKALIGAVHVDQGFIMGQKSSRHVLSLITLAVEQHIDRDSYRLQGKEELQKVLKQTKIFDSIPPSNLLNSLTWKIRYYVCRVHSIVHNGWV